MNDLKGMTEEQESSLLTKILLLAIIVLLTFIVGLQFGLHEGRSLERKTAMERSNNEAQQQFNTIQKEATSDNEH